MEPMRDVEESARMAEMTEWLIETLHSNMTCCSCYINFWKLEAPTMNNEYNASMIADSIDDTIDVSDFCDYH